MLEDQGNEEKKFDFTGEGEAVEYITLPQAVLLARRLARENYEHYKERLGWTEVVWTELHNETVGEDYYKVVLQFRRPGRGILEEQTGEEEFLFDLTGTLQERQILVWPEQQTPNNENVRDNSPSQSETGALTRAAEDQGYVSSPSTGNTRSSNPASVTPASVTRSSTPPSVTSPTVTRQYAPPLSSLQYLRVIAMKVASVLVGLWGAFSGLLGISQIRDGVLPPISTICGTAALLSGALYIFAAVLIFGWDKFKDKEKTMPLVSHG